MLKRQFVILWIGVGAIVLMGAWQLGVSGEGSWADEATWQNLMRQWRIVALATVLLLCLFRDWSRRGGDGGGGDEGAALFPIAPDHGARVFSGTRRRTKRIKSPETES